MYCCGLCTVLRCADLILDPGLGTYRPPLMEAELRGAYSIYKVDTTEFR